MPESLSFLDRIVALHSITLQMAEQSDELAIYRIAVTEGKSQLGLDRLGILRLDDDDPTFMQGTWGTDKYGQLADERRFRAPIAGTGMIERTLARRDLVAVDEPVTLLWCHEPVGTGWNAMVAMWQGEEVLGWISADNLLHSRPFTDEDREILKLLAASVP